MSSKFSGLAGAAVRIALAMVLVGSCSVSNAQAAPFTTLDPGFTQEVWASAEGFMMGGVAFAPDDDVLIAPCVFNGGDLRRFDAQTTQVVNSTSIHPLVATLSSDTGCGLTNHPDGTLYSNSTLGVVNLNIENGNRLRSPMGAPGNALGIAVDPQNDEVVYVGGDGAILAINPVTGASRLFSDETRGSFIDGIFFDPTGDFLFCANRTQPFSVTILDRDGDLVQDALIPSEPDGIAFRGTAPQFVLTVNLDGTMSRLDFPGGDFSRTPSISEFASGGFRGDLSQVGPDGCLYLTQNTTRFDNGTVSPANSVVRICGGFAPPPGVASLRLEPTGSSGSVTGSHKVTAIVEDASGGPVAGTLVGFEVTSGPNTGASGTCMPSDCRTDSAGMVMFSYASDGRNGRDTIVAWVDTDEDGQIDSGELQRSATRDWVGAVTTTTTTLDNACCDGRCGDPIEDGMTTASDALFVLTSAVGDTACDLCVCDVNRDFMVNSSDSLAVLRQSVDTDQAFNCPLSGPLCSTTTSSSTTTTTLISPFPNPFPMCAGQTCETFTSCNPENHTCEQPVCGSLAGGGGLCVEGQVPCEGLPDCTDHSDCSDGALCFVDSCCERPVCMPREAHCSVPLHPHAKRSAGLAGDAGSGPSFSRR